MVETNSVVAQWNEDSQKEADNKALIMEEMKAKVENDPYENWQPDNDEENDIMNDLNYRKLELIYNDYELLSGAKGGLDLTTFVKVMTEHFPNRKDPIALVRNLIDLFQQIDVNDDKTLEWVEFTSYIIELGMVRKDSNHIDAIKTYYPAEIKDGKHDTEIEHMFYLDRLQQLLVMEKDAKTFKVYNAKTGKMLQTVPESKSKLGNGGAFIAADYIELGLNRLVATTSNNNAIDFWDSTNYIHKTQENTPEIQLAIKWCGSNINRLYTGGCDRQIHCYDITKESKSVGGSQQHNPSAETDNWYHKEGEIMDLLPIPQLGLLASAGLDGKICLWRMDDMKPKPPLTGHVKGVFNLDWYADNHLILSAGSDHDVFIWNPHVTRQIFKLTGHNHSLVGVRWMKGTNQIISADISGMFRIWDVRTFTTVQTFNCPLNEINCMAITQPPKRIIAGGRSMKFFDYDEPTDHHLADDQACVCVLYNPVFYTFITAHPRCIKVWDATDGTLQTVFRDRTSKDITCMCMDSRNRKLFIGDQGGRVYCLNIKNGARMKKFSKPSKAKDPEKEFISSLVYWGYINEDDEEPKNNLLTASWDSLQRVYDDNDPEEKHGKLREEVPRHSEPINFLDLRCELAMAASASEDGITALQNHQTKKLEGRLAPNEPNPPSVMVCKFLKNADCIVTADVDGFLNFYAITPSYIKNTLLARVREINKDEQITVAKGQPAREIIYFPIRAIDYDPEERMLWTGDELGYMQKWDVSQLLDKLKEKQVRHDDAQQLQKETIAKQQAMGKAAKGTFITGTDNQKNEDEIVFQASDVARANQWKAHADAINWVCWATDLKVAASCSFDCNVYMWFRDQQNKRAGSLVLGNRAVPAGQEDAPEFRRYRNRWHIKVDKRTRYMKELDEASQLYDDTKAMDLEAMKDKGRKSLRQTSANSDGGESAGRPAATNLRKAQEVLQSKGNHQEQMAYKEGFDQMTEEEADKRLLADLDKNN